MAESMNPELLEVRDATVDELFEADVCPVCREEFDAVAQVGRLGRLEDVGVCITGDKVFLHGDNARLPAGEPPEPPVAVVEDVGLRSPKKYLDIVRADQ